MDRKSKSVWIQSVLEQYFPDPKIPLEHSDSYTLLIAVLLSAQCTDERVNKVTPKLFARGPTPELMIQLSVQEIEEVIRSCGLSQTKAKAIFSLSKILVEQYQGAVPCSFAALESLPGVGHKTASVVMSQAFHEAAFPVDTHIHRCAKRWGLSKGKNVKQTEEDLKKLFPQELWNRLHLQMIYFARRFCPARGHIVEKCPICRFLKEQKSDPKTVL